MPQYRVVKGRSIMLPAKNPDSPTMAGNLLSGPAIIPDGLFTKDELNRKIRDGFVVQIGADDPVESVEGIIPGRKFGEDPIDANKAPVIADGHGVTTMNPGGIRTETRPANPPVHDDPSPWTLNPDSIKDKSVDELRVMIQERDDTLNVEEFKSADEAIEFLSQDFKRG